jgi:Activator of Hsp90 ATPase homolog 1-like protein
MEKENFHRTITVDGPAEKTMEKICQPNLWWSKEFEGSCTKLNDEFIIRSGDKHYSKQKLVEFVPNERVVWLVTDSKLNWIEKDKYEWTGSKMIFELNSNGDNTELNFTHVGLVPGKECYEKCVQGWDMLIRERLPNA